MKMKLTAAAASLLACLALAACQQAAPANVAATNSAAPAAANASASAPASASAAAPTDLEQLAERLVRQSAGVREGETVLVVGHAHDQELLENIAVQVRKAGAFPMVELNSDRMNRRMYTDVPEKYDTQTDALELKLADIIDVQIVVGGSQTEVLVPDADPRRLAALSKAGEPVAQAYVRNKVRLVEVGNNLYPTAWRARRYGMPEAELAKTFWEGVNTDYTAVQTRGEQVRAVLSGGSELHITNPNGTDLRVRVQGRPVFVSDGIISPDDAARGGGAINVFLPAGEVYVTPVPGTAEGRVVHTRDFYEGKEIQNLTVTFAGGKVTSLAGAGEGFDKLKALYDAAEGRKDEFSFIDFGINPNVRLPAASRLGNWVTAGTVTVGIGDNTWAGGDNSVPYGYQVFLPGSTVTLDGRTIIENGELKI